MNTNETALELLQCRPEVGHTVIDEVTAKEPSYPLTSDVNENKVDGEKEDPVTSIEEVPVQSTDSINNNENCNLMCGQFSCKNSCEDNDSFSAVSTREMASVKRKKMSGRRGSKSRKNCNGRLAEFAPGDVEVSQEVKQLESHYELSGSDENSSIEQRNQKQLRESLFSLIREGFKQTDDGRIIPTCLYQIAETYFQDEDYEKAMQFIQLERIYIEQLLANLSAIQEQWETKQKTAGATTSLSLRKPERDLSSKELERLYNLCGSHQHPKISKYKLSASERCLRIQSIHRLMEISSGDDVDSPASSPDRESRSGCKPTKDRKPGLAAMTENSPSDSRTAEEMTTAADHQAEPGLGHTEDHQPGSSEGRSEAHTQSTGTGGRANTVSLSSGDDVKNNKLLQPEATPHCRDVSDIETFPTDRSGKQPGKPMVDKLISAGTAHACCVSGAQGDLPGESSNLDHTAEVSSSKEEEHCTSAAGDTKDAPPNKSNSVDTEDPHPPSTAQQVCPQETEQAAEQQLTVTFSASLLNGDLKDSDNFLGFQESEDDMSPSPGNHFLSLDELAKRIQVEEVHPAAGLVSILKKRNESEGETLAQPQTKPTKRKVRFQETDDVLDQDEIGGGSCILLIILCIATVFLSVGGTALYCTFGDEESSVCKDFSANMDFYYSQLLQGIEELKHWLFVT
ncbi:consortin [Pelobates fuscus]|uniref:consortin n=1 Tax=Pelobates fuscus TaxID=191477 RepID=UPI002FE49B5B